MTETVVVLGAGYAGAGAIKSLENHLDGDADIVWVADHEYHLVLHESHRVIRNPDVRGSVRLGVDEIKSPGTRFIRGSVTGLDTAEREISLDDGSTVSYDYALVALGSRTAYYGIPGLDEHSLTLKSLDDALSIHERVKEAAREGTPEDPATIVVGGAGLSGIQTAGEIAEFRDSRRAPVEIHLLEALEEIFPGNDPELQGALRKRLVERGIEISTANPITEADDGAIYFDSGDPLEYDVFVWTGGITGRDCLTDSDLENDHNRVNADANFRTSNDRVFAIGDSAIIDLGDTPAPPTAQAAWQAAEVAGKNLARETRGQVLDTWTYENKGTLISVGEAAVAHGIPGVPIGTFGGPAAKLLKKGVAARWIADMTSIGRAARAWPNM
jgi:NADH dehydrogenase